MDSINILLLRDSRLVEAEVIPTVLDDFVPSYALFVSWKHDKTALLGNTLDPSNLQKAPSVTLQIPKWKENIVDYGREGTHVITLTDPDAPSRDKPKWSEFCHWIGTGVPISHRRGVFDVKIYKDIIEYKPPGPPKGTGKHRYVFTVFLPADGTHELDLTKPKDRKHWGQDKYSGVREWAHENGLIPVGKSIC